MNIQQNDESYQNNGEYDDVNGGTGGNELSFDTNNIPPTKFM
jgi:hypothetical protein